MIIDIINEISPIDIEDILDIASKTEYIILTRNYLEHYIEDDFHNVIVVKDNGVTCGFLIYFIMPPDIDIIFIASSFYNMGYGSFLMDYLINDAKKNGVLRITLDLNEKNRLAKIFYEHKGFSTVAIRSRYYQNKYDSIIMETNL